MDSGPKIAQVAALVGDPARATMLAALMDGRALTASELAYLSGVAPQTASGHLAKLSDAGLLVLAKQGRRRFFRLASAHVGRMLEGIMVVAQDGPARHRNLWRGGEALRHARTVPPAVGETPRLSLRGERDGWKLLCSDGAGWPEAVPLDEPGCVVGVAKLEQRPTQVLDGVEGLHP